MKSISLKLNEHLLEEADELLQHLDASRNRYFNDAIAFYNQHQKRKMIEIQLAKESQLVSKDSLQVLSEFENLEDEF